jgi:uncharacterized membrane-anchored protein YitT (DUF2179 family)
MPAMKHSFRSIVWNLVLLTIGSLVFAIGAQAILVHHNFIIGGLFGTGMLIYYKSGMLSPGIWYLLLNIPLLIAGWIFLSRRFFLYSLYGVCMLSFFAEILTLDFAITDQLYAAVAGGAICGVGAGISLRSRGSGGGLDIIAIIFHQKFNFGVGKFFIASIIVTFVSSISLEHVLSLFNQRKIVYILSDNHQAIIDTISFDLQQGATLLPATGAYTGRQTQMIMTITNNLQLKRLEEKVFDIDPQALFIVENSFNVIGSNFGRRKIY